MKKLLYLFIILFTLSCGKGFLDVKPSSNTVVPTTLEDFQQLLDASVMRYAPELLDLQADDYYLAPTYWHSMSNVVFRNAHVWADDIFETMESENYGWNRLYEQIFYSNVVLDGLQKINITLGNQKTYDQVKGSALFIRAMALHYLLQLYSPAYREDRADIGLGVPMPRSSDVNEKVYRPSVHECYAQIIDDLNMAKDLLDGQVDFGRPSKVAAYALLARVYLMMGKYDLAGRASENSLLLYDDLTDLKVSNKRDYKKTIYLAFMAPATIIGTNLSNVLTDPELYEMYDGSDLRKTFLFRLNTQGNINKTDSYNLSLYCFSGLDTDEQYLIKAECLARLDKPEEAMQTLNHLLHHRFSTYTDLRADTKDEALEIILQERRKELVFRGLRWSDLKRYNRDGANITLARTLGDKTYTLAPNSNKWLFPIPPNEIKTSDISQNPR